MNCRRVRHLLLDFVDGLGNEALHAEVDRHVAECVECETFAAETTRSLALLRRTPVEPLDENFNWKVRLAIHREQKASAKRAASAGAWVRAWNFRYVASTGVAFALVLGAGVVTLQRVVPSGPAMPTAARDQYVRPSAPATTEVATHPATPRVTSPRQNLDTPTRFVSEGDAGPSATESAARGAIDPFAQEVAIDSLIDARLLGMTPEKRMRCIQRQIHRLQSQLEKQEAPRP
ncbi:MAG TPA: hypothetical protein VEC56_07400 [Candidatus Krumholzibacteria bacterium]|nr:hypothetical protein [Candidatus Krumholzibacteria bacterium]